MMRFGLWALAALVIGAFGAHFLLQDPGQVLIRFAGFNIAMSVPVLAAALVLLYVGVRLALRLWRAPKQLGEAMARQRARRAGQRLTQGLIHMTEGDFRRSERLLTDGLAGSESRVVNYLMAARAAEAQGSTERRDEWLGLARDADPRAGPAVLLTQAELQVKNRQYHEAFATLAAIEDLKPGHAGGLALAAETCLALGDRRTLAGVLPRLAKSKLDPDRLASLLARCLDGLRGDPDFGREQLGAVWSPLPLGLRRRPVLVRARALLLDRIGHGEEAVKSLAAALKRDFDRDLVSAYGEVRGTDVARQLRRAESWLRQYPENAVLLTATARLSMASELWGKARSYLESSLAIAPEPATYALYGELLDRLGERDEAARAYQAGLRLVAPELEPLPKLTAPLAADANQTAGLPAVRKADG
jgi:HemY protein